MGILRVVEDRSIAFHLERGDFENWLRMLGDYALADKIGTLRTHGLSETQLRDTLTKIVKVRLLNLSRAAKVKTV